MRMMGGFNFMAELQKAKQRFMGTPAHRYETVWKGLRDMVEAKLKGDRKHAAQFVPEVKAKLKEMLDLLVDELRDPSHGAIDLTQGAAPPVLEYMLRHSVIKTLCAYAKEPSLDLLMIHHIIDIIFFACPLLGHYHQVTEPLLGLLRHTQERVKPWEYEATFRQEHHQRCLSHGFIQLVYGISWQLFRAHNAIPCVDFFFLNSRDLMYDEKCPSPTASRYTSFLLLDFALPYLRRRTEVVSAQEIDFLGALHGEDRAYQIYTTEVAVDTLMCLARLQNEEVREYMKRKADMVSEMVCQSLHELCCELLDTEHCDEYRTKDVLADQLVRRLALLEAVALHPGEEFVRTFSDAFEKHILKAVFVERLERGDAAAPSGEEAGEEGGARCAWEDKVAVLELLCYFLDNVRAAPFCDMLLHLFLGVGHTATLRRTLLSCIASDGDVVPAALNVVLLMFKRRPYLVADVLIAPALAGCEPANLPTLGDLHAGVDALFHPALFAYRHSLDVKTLKDQQFQHLDLLLAVAAETGSAAETCVSWRPRPHAAKGVAFDRYKLPRLLAMRAGKLLEQPRDVTLVVLDLITTCVHLNNPKLHYFLLHQTEDEEITLRLVLKTMWTFVDSLREQYSAEDFKYQLEEVRREIGIVPVEAIHYERSEDSERLEVALLLEEWRRELRSAFSVLIDARTISKMSAPKKAS